MEYVERRIDEEKYIKDQRRQNAQCSKGATTTHRRAAAGPAAGWNSRYGKSQDSLDSSMISTEGSGVSNRPACCWPR